MVKDNYFEGLTGDNGRAALTFMNGLSDKAAPLALYKQVQKARIENNSFINTQAMTFGLRHRDRIDQTYTPQDTVVTRNLIANPSGGLTEAAILDDMSGIRFSENVGMIKDAQGLNITTSLAGELTRTGNGLYYPKGLDVGAPRDLQPFAREDVGPSYFEFPSR